MVKTPQKTTLTLFIFLIIFSFLSLTIAYDNNTIPENNLGFKREKLTHLHFYIQDVVSGRNPSFVQVAEAATTNASSVSFGMVTVVDELLTAGPEPTSKQVGRVQGMIAFASQSEVGLLMTLNYVFTEGKYNGSTISILGRKANSLTVNEMPIVGGSGLFKFARGYAQLRPYKFNATSSDAVFEYNFYVLHY
ncbi:Disease resistance response protein [Parasponia andersonii]|uniref:Dirigent protein n=1 Tax=Parasponia andersonii TaxID=3476 RepID=A0A2P5DSA8_PARAD|nr:Disease resistance response protein [Parasponia andersonii]